MPGIRKQVTDVLVEEVPTKITLKLPVDICEGRQNIIDEKPDSVTHGYLARHPPYGVPV
jgi:hypothetical protein